MKKIFLMAVFAACFSILAVTASAHAGIFDPCAKAGLLQFPLRAAGIHSEIIPSDPDTGYATSLYISDFRGSTVTIGIPSAGLRRGSPFLLEIDGQMATVICTRDGSLAVVDGDERIVTSGVFDIIGCILTEVVGSVVDLIEAIAGLNIIGIVEAAFRLILAVFECV
jgi:hypothetical protein